MALRGSTWESILALSDVVQRVSSYLMADERSALRNACRRWRDAVNAAVTTVSCKPNNHQLSEDLGSRFPNAHSLRLVFSSLSPADVSLLLQHLAAASAAFVARVSHLDLDLSFTSPSEEAYEDVLRFLSRCTSLQELLLNAPRSGVRLETHFKGRGRTPQERRDTMQQQLAAIHASPHILAPTSWPGCQCLVSLLLEFDDATAHEPELAAAATQTPSLRSLEVNYTAEHLPAWQAISGLSQLTSLRFEASIESDDAPWEQCQGMVTAIASLRSLEQLAVEADLLASPTPDTACRIPLSWSKHLPRLTNLELHSVLLNTLAPAPTMPALQRLSLNKSHPSGLADLFALTTLTSIACTADPSGEPAAAPGAAGGQQQGAGAQQQAEVPKQWKAGLRQLEWTFSRADMRIITELTSLTKLQLRSVPLSPSLGCSLARLPHLKYLALLSATITTETLSTARQLQATAFRPTFPALRFLACSVAALKALALWTNVRPGLRLVPAHMLTGQEDSIEFSAWGTGWLGASVCSSLVCSGARLLVREDSGVHQLVQASASLPNSARAARSASSSTLLVVLGEQVTGAGFAQLLQACPALHLGSPSAAQQVAPRLGRGFKLKAENVKQLSWQSARNLHILRIHDCGGLGILELAALVAAAPNLTQLGLQKVPALNDAMLCLLVACPLLEVLEVASVQTEAGHQSVGVLLSMLQRLRSLKVSVADAPAALRSLASDVRRAWKQAPGGSLVAVGSALLHATRTMAN